MEQNLSQYKIFFEVAKAGNISKAAKELFISQPAISKSISKLEGNLGVSLFTRNSRGVQLTDEGKLLYNHTEAAFEALLQGEQELKRIKEFHIGHLRIGVSNTLCKYILLPYLKNFIEKYPHIKITIESQSTAHTVTMLEQHRIDLGLIAEPSTRRPLLFTPLMEIQDAFVATKSYLNNLYLREGQDADIFQTGNILLLDKNNMTRKYIDEYLNENQIVPKQLLEVTTMDLLIEFAKIGMGIGCVIKDFVQKELDQGDLVLIPLKKEINKRTVGFAYNSNGMTTAMENFFDAMEAGMNGK
ncbi:LysR family transcriptional regulator [Lacrimispora sp. JR3]|uniref:LysR family transcriptional regulator n=1 Tax=Lacrimispora sinapis TaxID=3111456 RepID=UPI003749F59B